MNRFSGFLVATFGAFTLFLAPHPASASTNDLTTTLQKGLFEEEANHNLGAAIQLYESVASQFDKDRKLAATAIFRLAECYRKQGNTNEATALYDRVLREFSDQPELASLSRQNLITMGASAGTSTTAAVSNAARQEQKRLLEEEIKLVEKKLNSQQKQLEVGAANPDDLLPTQRELLQLQRQIAAVDAGTSVSVSAANSASQQAADAKAEAAALKAKLASLEGISPEERRIVVQQDFPNPVLTSLMQKLSGAQEDLALANKQFGPGHSSVVSAETRVKVVGDQVDAQVKGIMTGLVARLREAEARATALAQAAPGPTAAETAAQPSTSAEAEEVRRIQAMIKDSPDLINAKPDKGLAPLNSAASEGHLVVAQFLVDHGADLQVKESGNGWMPIHYAAYYGHKAIVELLLNHKCPVDIRNGESKTALQLAAEKGFRSVVELLLARGADVNAKANQNATALHFAVGNGFKSLAELLLAKGADPNINAPYVRVDAKNRSGTPLHLAVDRGDLGLTELLVTNKADLNSTEREGKTPLGMVAAAGNTNIAGFLLQHGAEVNAVNEDKDQQGWTALHYAVLANQKAMVDLLLEHKANPNAMIQSAGGFSMAQRGPGQPPSASGSTALFIACAKGYTGIVESLLAAKADPNLNSQRGDTTISVTLTQIPPPERGRILALLLDHGADPNATYNADGWTPLLLAANNKDRASLELLLSHKADPNAKFPREQLTALHLLTFNLDQTPSTVLPDIPAMVSDLVQAGADVNATDQAGKTPLNNLTQQLARGYHSSSDPVRNEIAEVLRKAGAVEDLARMDVIQIRRRSGNRRFPDFSVPIFSKKTNDYNHFTLFELLGAHYGFMSASPVINNSLTPSIDMTSGTLQGSLQFPALAQIIIRHPKPDRRDWTTERVNGMELLHSSLVRGTCEDIRLNWGDVVEIPEADHPINAVWQGLPKEDLEVLKRCLSRTVRVSVKGVSTNLVLHPKIPVGLLSAPGVPSTTSFMLEPVLYASGMLRASSDLSSVKVTRQDPTSGQSYTITCDCRSDVPGDRVPDLWLRDGDSIEVPDKP